jgi:hypothetical protein
VEHPVDCNMVSNGIVTVTAQSVKNAVTNMIGVGSTTSVASVTSRANADIMTGRGIITCTPSIIAHPVCNINGTTMSSAVGKLSANGSISTTGVGLFSGDAQITTPGSLAAEAFLIGVGLMTGHATVTSNARAQVMLAEAFMTAVARNEVSAVVHIIDDSSFSGTIGYTAGGEVNVIGRAIVEAAAKNSMSAVSNVVGQATLTPISSVSAQALVNMLGQAIVGSEAVITRNGSAFIISVSSSTAQALLSANAASSVIGRGLFTGVITSDLAEAEILDFVLNINRTNSRVIYIHQGKAYILER